MPSKNANCSSDPSSTRLQRNLAEKQRRYKLNSYISELANIVPMVSMSSKRLDKTSILRLSAAHLRIYQSPLSHKHSLKPYFKWRPNCLDADNIWKILEAVDGFLLLTTGSGKIIYISPSVERFLGHQHIEMIGHSLLSFVHPADVESVQNQLEKLVITINEKNGKTNSERCSFYCRIRERCQPRSEVVTYQLIHIVGHMTLTADKNEETESNSVLGQMNCLFKAFVRVVHTRPCSELSLNDAVEDEYITRHSLDGTIIFSDHRISIITGHLPHEVFGRNAYHYISADDIPVTLFAHNLMFANDVGRGLIVYRLRTSNNGRVYLKSSGYLQYDKSSSKIDHFVCVNKLLSDEEGEEELKKFIERYTPHIHNTTVDSMFESICSVQTLGMVFPNGKSDKEQQKLLLTTAFSTIEETPTDSTRIKMNLTQSKDHLPNNKKSLYYSKTVSNGTKPKQILSVCNNGHMKQSNLVSSYDMTHNSTFGETSVNDIGATNGTVNNKRTTHEEEFHYSKKSSYIYSECSSNEGYESCLSDECENQSTKQLPTIDCLELYPSSEATNRTPPQLDSSLSIKSATENYCSNDSINSLENFSSSKVFNKILSMESHNGVSPEVMRVVSVKSWLSANELSRMNHKNYSHNGDLNGGNHLIQQKLEPSAYSPTSDSKNFTNLFSNAVMNNNGSCLSECSDISLENNGDYIMSEL